MQRRAFSFLVGLLGITSLSLGISAEERPAPSFDCKKASSGLESLICSDPALAQADREMANAYQEAMAVSTAPEWLRLQQKTWLQTLSATSRCDIPAKAGEPIRNPNFTKARCGQEYKLRIAQLRAWKDAETGDCAKAVSFPKKFICANAELKAKEQRLDATVAALVQSDDDPMHRRQLQREHVQRRADLYAGYECSEEKQQKACIEHFGKTIETWQAFFDMLAKPGTLAESMPVDVPRDWWGVDVEAMFDGGPFAALGILAGPNRQPILRIARPLIDASGRLTLEDFKLVDLVTGVVLADAAVLPGIIETPHDIRFEASPAFRLDFLGDDCSRPVRYPVSYFPTDGSDVHMLDGRYFFRPLPKPEREDWKGKLVCDSYDEATWTFRYHYVTPGEWVRLADGTLVSIFGSRYVVRFRPDLTSPFFNGRSDIVSVPVRSLDALEGAPWHPLFVKAVEATLDSAIKEQQAARR